MLTEWQIHHDPSRHIHQTDLLIFRMLEHPARITPAEARRLEKIYCESQGDEGLTRGERAELVALWRAKFRDVRKPTEKQARKLSLKLLLRTKG